MNLDVTIAGISCNDQIKTFDKNNLNVLWQRRSGEKLYASDGQLKVMGFWQRCKYCFSSSFRTSVQTDVQRIIKNLTDHIDAVEFTPESRCNKEEFITQLFLTKLAPLSQTIFSRDLKDSVITILFKAVSSQMNNEEIGKNASEEYVKMYPEIKLWAHLGNLESLGGASGSYKIIRGKKLNDQGEEMEKEVALGIFKPSDEEPLAPNNNRTMQKIKRWLLSFPVFSKPFRGSLLKTVGGQAYLAEVSTKITEQYVLDAVRKYCSERTNPLDARLQGKQDWLQQLVPDTQVAHLNLRGKGERVGSVQLWIQGNPQHARGFFGVNEIYQTGDLPAWKRFLGSFLPISKGTKLPLQELKDKLPAELFDLLVIMDYATGNGDRHAENWFVMTDKTNVIGIRLIDGGQSMSPKHPRPWAFQELRNRYLWRNLKLSEEPFTDLGKFVIQRLYEHSAQALAKIGELYTKHQPNKDVMIQGRLHGMGDRIAVLDRFQKEGKTKYQLGKTRTHRDIEKVLSAAA